MKIETIKYHNKNKWMDFCSIVYILLILGFTSCNSSEHAHTEEESEEAASEDVRFLELNAEQYKAAEISTASIEERNLSEVLKVNGVLDVPPQNLISINAPYGGFLKSSELLEGSKVTKGQVIAVIEHPDYIQMQQDYMNNINQLSYLEKEYQRQTELQQGNASSAKVLQKAESEYKSILAMVKGLEAKFALIGINKEAVKEGKITSSINIISPINGYVTKVNANTGKYVSPQDVIFEIVDTEHLHVELTVFEKDISKIHEGQKIRFTLANEQGEERTATVHLIGRLFDDSRTVRIHGHLDKEDPHLLPGMYINAVIELGENKVLTVPKEAIVMDNGKEFVFINNEVCAEHPECSAHESCLTAENCKGHPDCETHEKCKEENCKEHIQCNMHEKCKEEKSETTVDKKQEADFYTFTKMEVKTGISNEKYIEIKFVELIELDARIVTKGAFVLLSQTKTGAMDACAH